MLTKPSTEVVSADGIDVAGGAVERARFWYEASSLWGLVNLRVDAGLPGGGDAWLGSARALGRVERLCGAVEAWLGCSLDIRPGPAVSVNGWQVLLHDTVSRSTLTVFLDQQAIASFPQWPEKWQEAGLDDVDIEWPTLPATLRIASFQITPDERAVMGAGAVLLLPDSFGEHWRCEVMMFDQLLTLFTRLLPSTSATAQITALPEASIGEGQRPESPWLTVDVDAALPIGAGHLLDRHRWPGARLADSLNTLTCTCLIDDVPVFLGQVGAVGHGYGLYITDSAQAKPCTC